MPDGIEGSFQLDHVAFGVPEVAAAAPFLASGLGGRPLASGPGVEFRWWQWQFARGATLEVLEPDGPPGGFIHRFLKSRGPGVHHVTFKVPDLALAAASAVSAGYAVVGYNDASPSWKECFLHPKEAQGIVVQMAETGPEAEPDDDIRFPFPETPPSAHDPADILGVRLNSHSEARARHQWETLLLGACEVTDRGLLFRWPDSPLSIAVEIDDSAPEGPVAIDVAADARFALPDGPHPVLGVSFARRAPPESC